MKKEHFTIGEEFFTVDRRWRCTDIGQRVIVAIRVDRVEIGSSDGSSRVLDQAEAQATGYFNGPPYGLAEVVFDEYDQEECCLHGPDNS